MPTLIPHTHTHTRPLRYLGAWMIEKSKESAGRRAALASIVSSRMLKTMCEANKVTPTFTTYQILAPKSMQKVEYIDIRG